MSKYSMHQVEVLTGIKAHTLRVWERRYGFLNPSRTETNIRHYSDDQLKKLLKVSILINQRYKISQINQMTDYEIDDIISKLSSDHPNEHNKEIQTLTVAAIEMNETDFDTILMNQIEKTGLTKTIFNTIYPFLKHIGVLWGTNKLIPAREHFVTNIIRQKIISNIDFLPNTVDKNPSIILFLPENEYHDIGLLMSTYIAKKLGWKVYYLGQNVSFNNVIAIHDKLKPTFMSTIISTPRSKKTIGNLVNIDKNISCPLLISSNDHDLKKINFKNVQFLNNLGEYTDILKSNKVEHHVIYS